MRTVLTGFILLLSFSAAAQRVVVNVSGGGGVYSMSYLKKFQANIREQFPFEPNTTDEFPPYFFYEASCYWKPGSLFFTGFATSYGSTGGRVQYRDYSGSLSADQLLKYVNLSVPLGVVLHSGKNMPVYLDLQPTYTLTFTELKFQQNVLTQNFTQSLRFTSANIATQPGIMVLRRINRLAIHAKAAYYVTLVKGKMYFKDDKAAFLTDGNDPVHATWDGLRLAFGLSFVIDD
jgi:hypothetical protein